MDSEEEIPNLEEKFSEKDRGLDAPAEILEGDVLEKEGLREESLEESLEESSKE